MEKSDSSTFSLQKAEIYHILVQIIQEQYKRISAYHNFELSDIVSCISQLEEARNGVADQHQDEDKQQRAVPQQNPGSKLRL